MLFMLATDGTVFAQWESRSAIGLLFDLLVVFVVLGNIAKRFASFTLQTNYLSRTLFRFCHTIFCVRSTRRVVYTNFIYFARGGIARLCTAHNSRLCCCFFYPNYPLSRSSSSQAFTLCYTLRIFMLNLLLHRTKLCLQFYYALRTKLLSI